MDQLTSIFSRSLILQILPLYQVLLQNKMFYYTSKQKTWIWSLVYFMCQDRFFSRKFTFPLGSKCRLVCSKCSLVCSKCSLVCSKCSLVCSKCSLICSKCSLVCSKCSLICSKCSLVCWIKDVKIQPHHL